MINIFFHLTSWFRKGDPRGSGALYTIFVSYRKDAIIFSSHWNQNLLYIIDINACCVNCRLIPVNW